MTTPSASNAADSRPSLDHVVVRLIDAINHLDGLGRLDHNDLGTLADALEPWPGPIGNFAIECRSAWQIARPPTEQDLVDLAGSDSLIEWGDEADTVVAPFDDEAEHLDHGLRDALTTPAIALDQTVAA